MPDSHLEILGYLRIRGHYLEPANLAAQMAAARGDVLVQPREGLHETFRRLRMSDKRPSALDPLDDPFRLELGKRLTHDRSRDVVPRTQLVVSRQPVPRTQPATL